MPIAVGAPFFTRGETLPTAWGDVKDELTEDPAPTLPAEFHWALSIEQFLFLIANHRAASIFVGCHRGAMKNEKWSIFNAQ
jgi:hypothetical protein